MTVVGGRVHKRVEGLGKKEEGLIDMDNSVELSGGKG